MLELPIGKEDQVVAAFPWRDNIVIITRSGKIFRLGVELDRGGDDLIIRRID